MIEDHQINDVLSTLMSNHNHVESHDPISTLGDLKRGISRRNSIIPSRRASTYDNLGSSNEDLMSQLESSLNQSRHAQYLLIFIFD